MADLVDLVRRIETVETISDTARRALLVSHAVARRDLDGRSRGHEGEKVGGVDVSNDSPRTSVKA